MDDLLKLYISICMLFVAASAQTPSPDVCPSGYIRYDGNNMCYKFEAMEKTWLAATEACKMEGGNLAQITNEDLQFFLMMKLQNLHHETVYDISTGNNYVYHYVIKDGIDVRGHTSIAFSVMACNDAHIALSKNNGVDSSDTYEIVIGGWGDHQSVIRDCKQCAHMDTDIQQDHPISCTEYKSFWISWANNIIKVGKGNVVGMETFLTWNDQNPHPVNYVAFATGWGSTGKWKVMRGTFNPGLFWIGGSDTSNETNWMWHPSNEVFEYTNWLSANPDYSSHKRDCALVDVHNGYKWRNDICEETRNYICEASPRKPGPAVGK